jgi:predicted ferric reductase
MARKAIIVALFFSCLIFLLTPAPGRLLAHPVASEWRTQLICLAGLCTLSLMTLSVLISARFRILARLFNGLDKSYIVHKWTGIMCAIMVTLHATQAGDLDIDMPDGVLPWQSNLFESGVQIVGLAFYLTLLLVTIALITKIPYNWFRKAHKVFPIVYLIAAFHGATIQFETGWFGSPGFYLLLLLIALGAFAALIELTQQIGFRHRNRATITQLQTPGDKITELHLSVDSAPFTYHPGQFAFLRFSHDKEPHPFTIASYDPEQKSLRFDIKRLGDFTSRLPAKLKQGQKVQIEGPYGEFQFNDKCSRQIWIAGGIGITPFLSKLDYLENNKEAQVQDIHFFYSTRGPNSDLSPSSIQKKCENVGVNFYYADSKTDHLTLDSIQKKTGDLGDASIWFCGPGKFGFAIESSLKTKGFNMRNFHRENFSLR